MWWEWMWLSVVLVVFRSWSYEWNKERNCKIALSVPELFLLERFRPSTVCVVYCRPKPRFMEYDLLSVKEVMREWPYHREQEPALFHGLQLDTFISSVHPADGANWMGRWLWQPCLAALGAKCQGQGGDAQLTHVGPTAIPGAWGREGLGQHPLRMWALAPQKNKCFALLHTGALHPFGGHWCPSVLSRTLPIQWQSNELLWIQKAVIKSSFSGFVSRNSPEHYSAKFKEVKEAIC